MNPQPIQDPNRKYMTWWWPNQDMVITCRVQYIGCLTTTLFNTINNKLKKFNLELNKVIRDKLDKSLVELTRWSLFTQLALSSVKHLITEAVSTIISLLEIKTSTPTKWNQAFLTNKCAITNLALHKFVI